jgi:putative (di)nucleoside polyphosphate hydrolase
MTKLSDTEIDQLPYRRGVGIVLLNGANQVFVAQRIDNPGPAWQMPQGGIDKGEDALSAAWRELQEETGVKSAEFIAETADWLRYDLPRTLVPKIWKGRYRGQEQKWFAFRFTGDESEIVINGEHAEFSSWRWADLLETPKLIVDFKRGLYEDIVKAFQHLVR